MLIKYILKNMRRSVVTNALFSLLLILAGALLALSAGLWYSVYRSQQNLEEIVTTIAVPDMHAVRRYVKNASSGDLSGYTTSWGAPLDEYYEDVLEQASQSDGYVWSWYSWFESFAIQTIQENVFNHLSEVVYNPDLFKMDDRRVYGAFAPEIRSVPFRTTEYKSADMFVEYAPQSIAAFVVTCVGTEEAYEIRYQMDGRYLLRSLIADFQVEEDVFLHDGRNRTRTVTGYFPCMNPDGSLPVEEGKRYIIMGYNYTQGDSGPTWYNAIPQARHMPNAIYIVPLNPNREEIDVLEVTGMHQFNPDILLFLMQGGIREDALPMMIRDNAAVAIDELGHDGLTWFEIEGSFEDALDSERGDAIRDALSVAEVSYNSLLVMTTEDVNSILRFNQRTNRFVQGRPISAAEYASGARVCLVSDLLAEINGLRIGDVLPLQMYHTELGQIPVINNISAWMPNPYHPVFELTEPAGYTIVGIFKGITQEMNDHAISPNTVIVPAASIPPSSIDTPEDLSPVRIGRQYDPPVLNTIIVENDEIDETRAMIDSIAAGYGTFFRFYDQGYATYKPVLANLRFGMTWIASLAAVGWAIAVVMFCLFYVGRKKKETMLLTGLGVSRRGGSMWVFVQSAAVIVLAQGLVLAASSLFFDRILNTAISVATSFTDAYRDFTLSEMNIAGGVQISLPLDSTLLGLFLTVAAMTALLLFLSGLLAARAARHRWSARNEE